MIPDILKPKERKFLLKGAATPEELLVVGGVESGRNPKDVLNRINSALSGMNTHPRAVEENIVNSHNYQQWHQQIQEARI